jgi:hypothetical protein
MVEKAANKSGLMKAKSKELAKCQDFEKNKRLKNSRVAGGQCGGLIILYYE